MEELIRNNRFRQVNLLLSSAKRNEIIEMRRGCGETLLHASVQLGNLEMTKRFVKTGVDVNRKDVGGRTFAHFASFCSSVTCLSYVCQYFPHLLNLQDKDGFTCLHWTVVSDKLCLLRVLLEHNVDVHVRNKEGQTALDAAKRLNKCHLVKELEQVSFLFSS